MKRPKKAYPKDVNQRAAEIFKLSTEDSEATVESVSKYLSKIGRKGGLKGGPARAKKLGAKRRSAIASLGGAAKAKKKGPSK
jgi:hypothetical protein